MKRVIPLHHDHFLAVTVALICGLVTVGAVRQQSTSASTSAEQPVSPASTSQQEIDPAKVVGNKACVQCHKSEEAAWQQSSHAKKSYDMLKTNPKAKEFAEKIGIEASQIAQGSSVCTSCHGTRQQREGPIHMLTGNSCESCHGGSGPQHTGWFKVHSDFGGENITRKRETEAHFEARTANCAKLGMNRSADIYALAKNCYQCHTVGNEDVVKAGHPAGNARFEFAAWVQGEVRHNFQLDQKTNAEAPTLWTQSRFGDLRTAADRKRLMYVIGQLVDLEVSLRNRGRATAKGSFVTATGKRITSAQKNLKKIDKLVSLDEVKAALAAAGNIKRSRMRKVEKGDNKFFGDIADQIAVVAQKLADSHDGSQLAGIDKLLPKDGKGTVYQP